MTFLVLFSKRCAFGLGGLVTPFTLLLLLLPLAQAMTEDPTAGSLDPPPTAKRQKRPLEWQGCEMTRQGSAETSGAKGLLTPVGVPGEVLRVWAASDVLAVACSDHNGELVVRPDEKQEEQQDDRQINEQDARHHQLAGAITAAMAGAAAGDFDALIALTQAFSARQFEVFLSPFLLQHPEVLLAQGPGLESLLHRAVKRNAGNLCRFFHETFQTLTPYQDQYGFTALHWAVVSNNAPALQQFGRKLLKIRSRQGLTPLHLAASFSNRKIVGLLVKRYSRELCGQQSEEGLTALHYAAARGHLEVMSLLGRFASEVSATTYCGANALHYVLASPHVAKKKHLVTLLLTFGCDPFQRYLGSYTPGDLLPQTTLKSQKNKILACFRKAQLGQEQAGDCVVDRQGRGKGSEDDSQAGESDGGSEAEE